MYGKYLFQKQQVYHDISWEKHHQLCHRLASKIIASGQQYTAIIAVSRGGLFPAGMLATLLNIRMVETISISSYEGEEQQSDVLVLKPAVLPNVLPHNILIVDDLVDTGQTAIVLNEQFPQADLAVLCAKPAGQQHATYYLETIPQDTWVRFPWDQSGDQPV